LIYKSFNILNHKNRLAQKAGLFFAVFKTPGTMFAELIFKERRFLFY